MSTHSVIVNGDDFGQSPGVNYGIIQAHEKGIVTSTSLMVRWPAASDAAKYARSRPLLGVGLHIDLCEWAYRDGSWVKLYEVVDEKDHQAVSVEILQQLRRFEHLMGRGPTHLDSHQHVHRKEPARSIVLEIAERLDIPVRGLTPSITYCDRFYGQDDRGTSYPEFVSVLGLLEVLRNLAPGATEIGCHPAAHDDLDTMYHSERLIELATLCDPGVRLTAEQMGIKFKSFAGWRSFANMEARAS